MGMDDLEPERHEGVLKSVQGLFRFLGHWLRHRDVTLYELELFENIQVGLRGSRGQPGRVDDLAEFPLALGNRCEDREVVPRFPELLAQEVVDLPEEKAAGRDDLFP